MARRIRLTGRNIADLPAVRTSKTRTTTPLIFPVRRSVSLSTLPRTPSRRRIHGSILAPCPRRRPRPGRRCALPAAPGPGPGPGARSGGGGPRVDRRHDLFSPEAHGRWLGSVVVVPPGATDAPEGFAPGTQHWLWRDGAPPPRRSSWSRAPSPSSPPADRTRGSPATRRARTTRPSASARAPASTARPPGCPPRGCPPRPQASSPGPRLAPPWRRGLLPRAAPCCSRPKPSRPGRAPRWASFAEARPRGARPPPRR